MLHGILRGNNDLFTLRREVNIQLGITTIGGRKKIRGKNECNCKLAFTSTPHHFQL